MATYIQSGDAKFYFYLNIVIKLKNWLDCCNRFSHLQMGTCYVYAKNTAIYEFYACTCLLQCPGMYHYLQ
jgi:hypothetical protein